MPVVLYTSCKLQLAKLIDKAMSFRCIGVGKVSAFMSATGHCMRNTWGRSNMELSYIFVDIYLSALIGMYGEDVNS